MREWKLRQGDPMAPVIAADARGGRTDVADDQIWQLRLGQPDEPALALETRYGGRVGLARLVPMWVAGRRRVYEAQGYHEPPALTVFAPDYLRVEAGLTLAVRVRFEFWAMESHAVGGRVTCRNTGDQPETLRFDLAAQAARENKTLPSTFLTLENGWAALQVGRLVRLQPVLLVEGGTPASTSRAELGREITLAPGQELALRWALAARPDRDESLALAYRWLAVEDWEGPLRAVLARLEAQPSVETGHADWDAALAWSQQGMLRSFLAATGSLPHPSFVSARRPNQGYAPPSASEGFTSAWGGQTLPEALLLAAPVALAAPELAKGIIRNFLAVQREDGWIDARPGLEGQRTQVLAPPLLAALTERVFEVTRDRDFAAGALDGLLAFFRRWFQPDVDRDDDGVPEWSRVEQGAFAHGPVLARAQRWAQGVEVSALEAPDLLAYLLREGRALRRLAITLNRQDVAGEIQPRVDALAAALDGFWDEAAGVYHYRDRDAHTVPSGVTIFSGRGDQALRERTPLPQPGRLILRVMGGMDRKPALDVTLEGTDANGQPANETLAADAFDWYRGMGAATTRTVWSAITYLRFGGLSRVLKVEASTLDLTPHDQALLMPLWAGPLPGAQAERTIALLTDPARYWRPFGVSGCPADQPAYQASTPTGCGGVWPGWNDRLGEALIEHGRSAESAELFRRVLAAQIRALRGEGTFRAQYHPDTGEGQGDAGTIEGMPSFGWFARLFGAFVLDPGHVVLTGPLAFAGETMTWTQHGVRLLRSADGTEIAFPSGATVRLPADAPAQAIEDPALGPAAGAGAGTSPPDPLSNQVGEGET